MSAAAAAPGRLARLITGFLGTLLLAGVVVLILYWTGVIFGEGSGYRVRAIFDDASNIVTGEQVEVAGVPVGSVDAIEPTPQAKAAVVLRITRAGFKDFRADASCTIRPQSLLGEKYVDCQPTQERGEAAQPAPPLALIPEGQEGAGQRLLPLQNTSSPVETDVITDINQLPENQRLRIILNELGAGLEGTGSDLHEVIQRANPALRETNRVLALLANDNQVLVKLAVDSDRALAPMAEVRARVADYLVQSRTVAQASARHSGALAENFKDFPAFLQRLGPAMDRIGHFAAETTPTMRELGGAAPGLNRLFAELPAFSSKSTGYFESLGSFGKSAGPDLVGSERLLNQLLALGGKAQPFAGNLSTLLSSFRSSGGVERLMDFIFLAAGATNGYDSLGHFLRAMAVASATCSIYLSHILTEGNTCSAQLRGATAASSTSASVSAATLRSREAGGAGALAATRKLLEGAPAQSTSHASRLLLNYLMGE